MNLLPWFRFYNEAVDDEKLRLLAFEDRWHYVALLCCKSKGLLDEDSPLMRRKIAVKLGLDSRELDEVARRLSEVELIDQESLQPLGWQNRQFRSDVDPSGAERQRKLREKRRAEKDNALGNASVTRDVTDASRVTDTNVTPLDTDTDTEEEEAKASLSDIAGAMSDGAEAGGADAPKKTPPVDHCPHQDIIALYHDILPELPVTVASRWRGSTGESDLRTRWKEDKRHQSLDFWRRFFATIRTSRHWMGENDRDWRANLQWLVKRGNFDKAVQRMVDNARQAQPTATHQEPARV